MSFSVNSGSQEIFPAPNQASLEIIRTQVIQCQNTLAHEETQVATNVGYEVVEVVHDELKNFIDVLSPTLLSKPFLLKNFCAFLCLD